MRDDLRTAERKRERRSSHWSFVSGLGGDREGVEVRNVSAGSSSESAEDGTDWEVSEGPEKSFERVLDSSREERGEPSRESSDGPSFDGGKLGKKPSSQSSSSSNERRNSIGRGESFRDRASESTERRNGDGKTVG